MLRLSEEIVILALNEKTGLFQPLPDRALDFAIAGSIIMELVYAKRLDAQLNPFRMISSAPTGEPVEDYVLNVLSKSNPYDKLIDKLHLIAAHGKQLKRMLVKDFLDLGVMMREKDRLLGVTFRTHYYMEKPEVRTKIVERLKAMLFQGKPSMERDLVLLGLIAATKIYRNIFTLQEIEQIRPLFEKLRIQGPDLIAQEIWKAVNEVQHALKDVIAIGL